MLGSRTCPWGITLRNISVNNVHVHRLGDNKSGGNRFSSLWAVGTLGTPLTTHTLTTHTLITHLPNTAGAPFGRQYAHRLKKLSNLDRWFFCSNEWWRGCTHGGAAPDCNIVRQSGLAASFEGLIFANWTGLGAADGSSASVLYNFAENASTLFTNVVFNTISVTRLDNLLGEKVLADPPVS